MGMATLMITTMTIIITARATTICARPMCMCWPMRAPACSPSSRSLAAIISASVFSIPLAALVGAFVIASWAYGLIRDSAMVLLDADADPKMSGAIKSTIERDLGARVADLHLWRLGPGHQGLIVSLVSPGPTTAEEIKGALRQHYPGLSHVTVEVAVCADCA